MAHTSPLHEAAARAGAVTAEEAGWAMPWHYGDAGGEYQAAVTGAALFDVSHRGKVELTGPEAAAFLHNLCTNDIKDLPLGAGCEAFLTTNKAKVFAHLYVYHLRVRHDVPALWLDTPPGTNEAVLKHLDRFLISEAAEFADRTREFAQVLLAGPDAAAVLGRALRDDVPPLENLQHMMRTFGSGTTVSIRRQDHLGVPGWEVVCLNDRAEGVWELLRAAGARPAGLAAYDVLRVEAGTPKLGADMDEGTFAPEVGRTAQAISYTKGCYLGQEPIVMARDRGHINRALVGLRLQGGPVPHNSPVVADGKEVGRVTSSVASPRFGTIGLGYVRRAYWEPGTAVEVDAGGTRVAAAVAGLPFGA